VSEAADEGRVAALPAGEDWGRRTLPSGGAALCGLDAAVPSTRVDAGPGIAGGDASVKLDATTATSVETATRAVPRGAAAGSAEGTGDGMLGVDVDMHVGGTHAWGTVLSVVDGGASARAGTAEGVPYSPAGEVPAAPTATSRVSSAAAADSTRPAPSSVTATLLESRSCSAGDGRVLACCCPSGTGAAPVAGSSVVPAAGVAA